MGPLLLAVDLGGTNLRAAVLDEAGRRVSGAIAETAHVLDVPPIGRRYCPDALWAAACTAIRAAVAGVDGEIVAVAATGQRLACAFLDAAGETLYVAPNTDARGVMCGWQVEEAAEGSLYSRTGRGMPLLFAPSRLLWFKENQPEVFDRVAHVLGLGDWLAHRLSGEVVIDISGAVELLAVDVATGRYWPELWTKLGLNPAWLPPIRPAGAAAGGLTRSAAEATGLRQGLPVAVCPPDSMAALLGSGAAQPGWTVILAGSTMPVLGSATEPIADATGRTWTGRHPIGGRGVNESNAGTTGFGWAWVVERLVGDIAGLSAERAYARAEELARTAPVGCGQTLAFSGGGSVMNASRPATFLTRFNAAVWPAPYVSETGAGELVRACLEAVAHSARANLEQVEAARGGAAGPVVLAGGMSRSPLFLEMVAGTINRPVRVPALWDATSVGAAMSAAVTAGLCADLEQACSAMTSTAVAAEPDPTTVGAHSGAHREWRALYGKIESL